MTVVVNYWAILLCGILSLVLGSLWYGPLFGKQWMALSGINPGQMTDAQKKGMWKSYVLALVGSLVMAYVLQHSLVFANTYLNVSGLWAGLQGGFWMWLGFVAPVTLGTVLWEGKSWKLWTLLNSYHLIQLLIFGAVLTLWK